MAREIPLTRGLVAIVDDEDFDWLNQWAWRVNCSRDGRCYAHRWEGAGTVVMHRAILKAEPGSLVDHVNGDGLDNRRANLRPATRSQNACNKRTPPQSRCGFRGVTRAHGWWVAVIKHNGVTRRLGRFDTPEAAARAYDEAARRLHGEFASPNFPDVVAAA